MPRQHTGTPPKNRPPPVMDDLKELESLPPRTGGGDRLCDLERMAILHGMECGMSPSRIAAKWKFHKRTV